MLDDTPFLHPFLKGLKSNKNVFYCMTLAIISFRKVLSPRYMLPVARSRIAGLNFRKKTLGPYGSKDFRFGRQHKFFGGQKHSIILEAFSLFLVFSVQTKPNKMLHLNVSRSKQKNNFNAEIHLPYSNWFDHLSFFWPFMQFISSL